MHVRDAVGALVLLIARSSQQLASQAQSTRCECLLEKRDDAERPTSLEMNNATCLILYPYSSSNAFSEWVLYFLDLAHQISVIDQSLRNSPPCKNYLSSIGSLI